MVDLVENILSSRNLWVGPWPHCCRARFGLGPTRAVCPEAGLHRAPLERCLQPEANTCQSLASYVLLEQRRGVNAGKANHTIY